jgi:hypothetical protein
MSTFTINPVKAGGGSRFFKPADFENHLQLITKVTDIHDVDDKFKGVIPAAFVDFIDLDSDGDVHENVQITHGGIVGRLVSGDVNVLGRVGKVPTAKGYQAWVLKAPAVEDVDKAQAWGDKQAASSTSDTPWDSLD